MIVGHQKQWEFLKKSAELGKVSHAYLFSGQEKLGKKTLALEFIKLLNCELPNFQKRPCQTCRSCQDIQKNQSPDFLLIEPENKEIQIGQIRELSWKLSLKSYSAPFKSVIIDRAHTMNQEAQTGLLKTLEEPRGERTLLILISEHPSTLFSTILSRAQEIKFPPVKKSEMENYLKERKIKAKEVEELLGFFRGSPGEILDFISDSQKLKARQDNISFLARILNSSLASRFQYAKKLADEPQNLKEILDVWLSYFRDSLISRVNDQRSRTSLTDDCSPKKLKKILRQIQRTNFLISTTNVNPRLALEVLMLEF